MGVAQPFPDEFVFCLSLSMCVCEGKGKGSFPSNKGVSQPVLLFPCEPIFALFFAKPVPVFSPSAFAAGEGSGGDFFLW